MSCGLAGPPDSTPVSAVPRPAFPPVLPAEGRPAAMTSSPSPPPAPAEDALAAALGRIPSGLFVVTWREADGDRTMLASWVTQAGFAPPAVSIAVAPSRDLLAAVDRGTSFVVNILGDAQRSLLSRFGRPPTPGEAVLEGLAVERTAAGNAILAGSSGWLECRGVSRAAGGDHVVVVAEVVAGGAGPAAQPLVHVRKNGYRY